MISRGERMKIASVLLENRRSNKHQKICQQDLSGICLKSSLGEILGENNSPYNDHDDDAFLSVIEQLLLPL